MPSALFHLGYVGLFGINFLAATVLPFSAGFATFAMVAADYNLFLIIAVATAGSFLGSVTNYFVGLKGTEFVMSRYVKVEPVWLQRAENFFDRWGAVVLFFSWMPFIGDALTLVAGVADTDFKVFTFWVLVGKLLRQIVLVLAAMGLLTLPWFDFLAG